MSPCTRITPPPTLSSPSVMLALRDSGQVYQEPGHRMSVTFLRALVNCFHLVSLIRHFVSIPGKTGLFVHLADVIYVIHLSSKPLLPLSK